MPGSITWGRLFAAALAILLLGACIQVPPKVRAEFEAGTTGNNYLTHDDAAAESPAKPVDP